MLKKNNKWLFVLTFILAIGALSFVDNHFELSKNLSIFTSIYEELNTLYVDEPQPGKLMKTGIDAMLRSLDPYTNYIPESDIEDYRFMTTGEYGGIGAMISKRGDYVMITDPYEGYPAQKAGLVPGDLILEVDGKSVKGKTTSELSKILKGQANTPVRLLIQHDGAGSTEEKVLIRQEIKIKEVPYYGMLNEETGYIKLTSFTEKASSSVKDAFLDLRQKNHLKALVLDLRGNGGGLLKEAVNIVNFFVPKGSDIVSTRGRISDWNKVYKAVNVPLDTEIPLAVLIDGHSASASEIVAGGLQDLDRAVVVGSLSFGKGLVQQTRDLSYNSILKLTVAKYYTPSGRCIQKLDYSHRKKDGSVEEVPDSLIQTFYTKNGRPVQDGKGITPDIEIKPEPTANITASLIKNFLVFDFANKYYRSHKDISDLKSFSINDEDYEAFKAFLAGKSYDYTTRTEDEIEQLKEVAEKEHYLKKIQPQIDALNESLHHNKAEDLETFKQQISGLITGEIASRIAYQHGRIEVSLQSDLVANKALEVLADTNKYQDILSGGNGRN